MDDSAARAVRLVSPEQRVEGHATPAMVREEAIAVDGMWAGIVRTLPGMVSGWHHHGAHETTIYVLEGRLRLEFGPGGGEVADAGPGDFLHVPAGAVHREGNPSDVEGRGVIVRAGRGEIVVNVDGPAAARPSPLSIRPAD